MLINQHGLLMYSLEFLSCPVKQGKRERAMIRK